MASSATPSSGIAARYAASLFDVALEAKALDSTEKDLARFDAMIAGSDDLQRLLLSPVFSAEDQFKAVTAVLAKAKIGGLVGNFIKLVARNRRLFAMPGMLGEFRKLIAAHRGEETADVTVAAALTDAQEKELRAALKSTVGKNVAIRQVVDPAILGGMIVKIGSRQIDSSLRTKLSSLKLSLKEAG